MSKSQLMDLPWSGSPLATLRSHGPPRYLAVFLLNLSECYRIRVSFQFILDSTAGYMYTIVQDSAI